MASVNSAITVSSGNKSVGEKGILQRCDWWLQLAAVRLNDSVFLEKRNQFIHPEVGKHLTVPIHGGSFGLAGEFDHFKHRLAIAGDDESLYFDVLTLEIVDDFVAPRATAFDVKNR